jgi:hypothetical protein
MRKAFTIIVFPRLGARSEPSQVWNSRASNSWFVPFSEQVRNSVEDEDDSGPGSQAGSGNRWNAQVCPASLNSPQF